ncbi:methyl-accepting chemotaxis protein [Sphingomonas pokkalii]|nr:methyl-accepting chemotaxis protein [Sphingomonas pokkalii]
MMITARVRTGALALMILLLGICALAAWRIDAIRMGGPMHLASMQVADLNADILPPPEYVIEPYLQATLLLHDPARLALARARLATLRRQYDDRHAVWATSALPEALKRRILVDAHAPAQRFWQELQGPFLAAMEARDASAAQRSYALLTREYEVHRHAIDALVEATAAEQANLAQSSAQSLGRSLLLLAGLGLVLLGTIAGFAWWLIGRVVRPLSHVAQVTTALSRGRDAPIPYLDRQDELGEIAHALQCFHDAAATRAQQDADRMAEQSSVRTMLADGLAALEQGDMRHRLTTPFPAAQEPVRDSFNRAATRLCDMLRTVNGSARNVGTGSGEIATASEDLARRTESTAHALQETSGAIQLIENRLKATMHSAEATMTRADTAASAVRAGRNTAESAAAAMRHVSQRANDIDTVVEGLDKIAFQTRVLAMNAAVEAGRAGETGRGFAVVADLVSALALRAEEEAKRGRSLINETQVEVALAASEVSRVDEALAGLVEDFDGVHALLEAMREDNRSQATAITEITQSVVAMETATQQNAAMVEQASAAARSLHREAETLLRGAEAFRVEADTPATISRSGRSAWASPMAAAFSA